MSASSSSERLPAPSFSERGFAAGRDEERGGQDQGQPYGGLKPVGQSWEDYAIEVAISEHLDWFMDEL